MVAIRAMALNELSGRDALKVAWKELRLGAMLGLILGATIAVIAIFVLPFFHPEVAPGITFPAFGSAVAVALADGESDIDDGGTSPTPTPREPSRWRLSGGR